MLIHKNIDEFGIVCKKKKSVLQENYDHFVWSFFFFSLFFFFFPLRNVKVGGAAYTVVRPLRRQIRYFNGVRIEGSLLQPKESIYTLKATHPMDTLSGYKCKTPTTFFL